MKIYHNPRCSKSRETLNIILENNIKGIIIGNPLNMDGSSGRSAQSVNDIGFNISKTCPIMGVEILTSLLLASVVNLIIGSSQV